MSKYAPHKPSSSNPKPGSSTLCQKCLKRGHFTYQCKNERPYLSRPSRTQQLVNPSLREKMKIDVEVPEEFKKKSGVANKILEAKEKERETGGGKKRKRSDSESESSSESDASSESDSDSDSGKSESSKSASSDAEFSSSQSVSSRSLSRSRSRDRRRRRARSPGSPRWSSDEDDDRR